MSAEPAAKRLTNMDIAKMVVDVAVEQYAKDWKETAITLEFSTSRQQSGAIPALQFLPQTDAWVFRHAGMQFRVPREKGPSGFNETLEMLSSMVLTTLGVYGTLQPKTRYPYRDEEDEEEELVTAVLSRAGKELTRMVVCKVPSEEVTPVDLVRGLRTLMYMQ
eukprot:XP_001700929.1 predicted protein [Chlamydomonas reinhardtii]